MKAFDIVKPPARTEQEAHERWLNRLQSDMVTLHKDRKIIEVK